MNAIGLIVILLALLLGYLALSGRLDRVIASFRDSNG